MISQMNFQYLPQPTYSSHLAITYYYIFGMLQEDLGEKFLTGDEVKVSMHP